MRRAVVLALALWGILAATASADVYDDNPATASRAENDQWAFVRAADGAIYARHFNGSIWSEWSSLGGNLTSGPAAVAYGGTILVFARGADGAIHQQTLGNGGWSGWTSLGGVATSAPAASVRRGPENFLDLAIRGTDNTIYHRTFVPGRGWTGWASIDGNLTSGPAMNSQSNGIVNIWARGADGTLMQRSWTGTAWTGWSSLGGGIIGAPATISRAENVIGVYARGGGDGLYQLAWSSGWAPWYHLDATPLASSPAAGADSPSREYVFARGGSGLMRKEWTATTGWGPWTDFGPIALPAPAPAPPAPAPDGEVNLETGVRCTPAGGRLRVSIKVRKPKGAKRARVSKIVFYTKGKGRAVRSDRKSPFVVRIRINRPAGSTGRVYARVYYRRSAKGKLHRKTVSRRYTVCR